MTRHMPPLAPMALRWTAAAMLRAKKGFRRLRKAHKQLAALRIALKAHYEKASSNRAIALRKPRPRRFSDGSDHFAIFNKAREIPGTSLDSGGYPYGVSGSEVCGLRHHDQLWMPLMVGAVALYISYLWKH